ncbi:hypothetical protein ABZP36_004926 [Zizania latifolia]
MEPVVEHARRPIVSQRLLKAFLTMDHTERRLQRHVAFAVMVGHHNASSADHVKHRLMEYLQI